MKRTISIILPALFFIFFLQGSCEKEDESPTVCGVKNPHENLEWLKTILNKRFCTEVYKITYKGEEYIGVYDCPETVDGGFTIYNCDGAKYCEFHPFVNLNSCSSDFWNNMEKTLIYKQEE